MVLAGRILLLWVDPDMRWKSADFANITTIPIPEARLWTPRLSATAGGADVGLEFADSEEVAVNQDGLASLVRLVKLRIFTDRVSRHRAVARLQFQLKGLKGDSRLQLLFWHDPSTPLQPVPGVVPTERFSRLSHLWSFERAQPVSSANSRLLYDLVVVRKPGSWAEVAAIRGIGLLGGLFFAFIFPMGEPGRRHLRFFGLFAALLLQLTTELLARSFSVFPSQASLADAAAESQRELALLVGWALCLAESLLLYVLLRDARCLASPLSRVGQRLLGPLLRVTGRRPMEATGRSLCQVLSMNRLPRPPSMSSTMSQAAASSLRAFDSGLSSGGSSSPDQERLGRSGSSDDNRPSQLILKDHGSNSASALLRRCDSGSSPLATLPEEPPPLQFRLPDQPYHHVVHQTAAHNHGYSTTAGFHRPPFHSTSCAASTFSPYLLRNHSPTSLNSSASGSPTRRPLFARRDALLALDRLLPFLLAPAAALLLFLSSP